MSNTLHKSERLNKKKLIDKLFAGGSRSLSLFPLRVVYQEVEEPDVTASILVSVSKRHFKQAVKRNRVKRLIREAYRTNKHLLSVTNAVPPRRLTIAFIYISDSLADASLIRERMKTALARINETLQTTPQP